MAYFSIYQGFRGCYMPDSAYVVKADTRKELKAALQWEAYYIRNAGGIGLNEKAIAWLANIAWHYRKTGHEYVAPYRFGYHGKGNYCMALGVFTGMTRQDYLSEQN